MGDKNLIIQRIEEEVRDYWNSRANGFSIATEILLNDGDDSFNKFFGKYLAPGRMKILDVGTGAGYAAISLAKLGNEVVGIDTSPEMIKHARENAKKHNVDIEFIVSDAQKMTFVDESFDAVVSRDVLWSLNSPSNAYQEYLRVLRPGGRILVIDGNYYLNIYDPEYRKKKVYNEFKNGMNNNIHAKTNVDNVDFKIIEELAKELPLSKIHRPFWDVSILFELGVKDISVKSLDKNDFSVPANNGSRTLISKFLVVARKEDNAPDNSNSSQQKFASENDVMRLSTKVSEDGFNQTTCNLLKILSDRSRMRIVLALRDFDLNVTQMCKATGCSQSHISHNLKILKDCGIVKSERIGKEVYYAILDKKVIDNLICACKNLSSKSQM